jgi:hypothetical protein
VSTVTVPKLKLHVCRLSFVTFVTVQLLIFFYICVNKMYRVYCILILYTFYYLYFFGINVAKTRNFYLEISVNVMHPSIYNTCALSKHMGNMCMRLRNAGKGEASPSLFPHFAPNTHIYLYASTVHMYCMYPAILNRK